MTRFLQKYLLFTVILTALLLGHGHDAPAQESDFIDMFSEIAGKRSTADLSYMKEQKVVRALLTLSKTDFFIHDAQPKGIQVELLQAYEDALNKGVSRRELRTRIQYIPVPFNELIPALMEGRGDIAAALLSITPEREGQVSFVSGRRLTVNEVLVTNQSVTDINDVFDLAGRQILVLSGSSYAEHLRNLNVTMASRMMAPIRIVEGDPNLLSEDIMELVNAGAVNLTVVDDYKAELWAQVFPNITVRNDVMINESSYVGWAVRKNNPELEESLNNFLPQARRGSNLGNMLAKRYYGNTRWIRNPLDDFERAKLEQFMLLFRKYGEEYEFDWLAVVAQAYQESGLDHGAESHVGAIGIMQVLPTTGEYVGIPDVTELEANIHAGVKYVTLLRDKYFSDPELSDIDRLAFTWAAYNAGPSKVRRMRTQATKLGLDANKWFQNTEYAALHMVGQETVQYVANIYKYYIAYSLSRELLSKRAEQLRTMQETD